MLIKAVKCDNEKVVVNSNYVLFYHPVDMMGKTGTMVHFIDGADLVLNMTFEAVDEILRGRLDN